MSMTTVEELEAEALRLPTAQRARLVEKLIASLDSEPDIESAWAEEVERRHAEIESGAVTLLPGKETLARLRADFK
ncbi:putative addiction module component [mine drainage metagenome]|uniref:Putative addiction module component n=1 Tax=mine drainage metagenome TaxID=410659 RepID=A0A1J5RFB2_9ZZZZ